MKQLVFKSLSGFKTLQNHKEILYILFLSFILRYFLMDWNSYWFDELLSVVNRGINLGNPLGVLRHYKDSIIPHPLYEFILYGWMHMFGHSEVATRCLSTLFVVLAILMLYVFTFRIFGKRVAIATALFFSLCFMSVYYSLESRYYGLILFLSTFSSLLFLAYLQNIRNEPTWKKLFLNKYFFWLTFVNTALTFSHPFNFLFLASQGLFLLIFLLCFNTLGKIFRNLLHFAVLFVAQFSLMIAFWVARLIYHMVWGNLHDSETVIKTHAISTSTQDTFKDPFLIFLEYVAEPNLRFSDTIYALFFLLVAYIIFKQMYLIAINYKKHISFPRKFFIFYVLFWAILPCIFVFAIFTFGKYEKLSPRYLIFCTPPLMILLILAFEQAISLLGALMKKVAKIAFMRFYLRFATFFGMAAAALIVLPGGYDAATTHKEDWRGIDRQIIRIVKQDSLHNYIIYESTSNGGTPILEYYFRNNSGKINVSGPTRLVKDIAPEEANNELPGILGNSSMEQIKKYDYLIIIFTHKRVSQYPLMIDKLGEQYEKHYEVLDWAGRGFIVFKVHPDNHTVESGQATSDTTVISQKKGMKE